MSKEKREHWSSSLGFVLAAAGSAIGLGNIWKFPYIAGENGGGAFVMVYLLSIMVIGLPVMLCEITIGRKTQKNPVGAYKMLYKGNSHTANMIGFGLVFTAIALIFFNQIGWSIIFLGVGLLILKFGWTVAGMLGVFSGFVILSYYSVVGGWTLGYIFKSFTGQLNFTEVAQAKESFGSFISSPWLMISLHLAFMVICAVILIRGVRKGIELWSKILMPVLFVLLLVLILRSITLPNAINGVSFFLSPDFSKLSGEGVLTALGHAFFTLSLGMGAMITYGSYISREENIFTSTLSIVALDTLIAILAGLAIFPAVFAQGFSPTEGPGLVFNVLPTVFNSIPFGWLWAGLFFLALSIAAITSGMSLLEVVVAYCVDELKWPRTLSILLSTTIIAGLGIFSAVSIANWNKIEWMQIALQKAFDVHQPSFLEMMDLLSSNWLLPLSGLACSLFVGWIWGTRKAIKEIRHGSHNFADVHLIALLAGLKDDPSHNNSQYHVLTLASLWGIFIRFLTPVAVMIAFLHKVGWISLK